MKDIKDTIFLPKTDYKLRPDFLKSEPEIISEWNKKDIYNLRNEGKTKMFVLHSGPPYANFSTHIGHSFNVCRKSIITNTQSMAGKKVSFIPGWDCHGLPIEWAVEENFRKSGRNKNDISVEEFRKECREYAQHWVNIQSQEFQRLGIFADWKQPYLTLWIMKQKQKLLLKSEVFHIRIYIEIFVLFSGVLLNKLLWQKRKLNMLIKKITSIYVKFPVFSCGFERQEEFEPHFQLPPNTSLIAWTTTPWTLPTNKALAINENIEYALFSVTETSGFSATLGGMKKGERFIIASNLLDDFCKNAEIKASILYIIQSDYMKKIVCKNIFSDEIPVLHGDFVTAETGTGIVHIAPSHGLDDFYLCKKNKISLTDYVLKDGTYKSDLPVFGGMHIYKALQAVLKALGDNEILVCTKDMTHSTAVSWRSKAPLIYLATPQWFINMSATDNDGMTIRERSLKSLDDVKFIPDISRNRLTAMVQSRPDWCISRQRTWGVPITLFVHKQTGEILRDCDVDGAIDDYIQKFGADIWFKENADYFLNAYGVSEYNPDDYEMIMDIVDVWFESGCSFAYVLESRGLPKADVYLEGSDQHRGWFQASLIESCGYSKSDYHKRGSAPFKTLITDGFVLDKHGKKMSKSDGNVIPPEKIISEFGADVLRLWVATCDATEDVKIGDDVMKQQAEMYKKFRNTLRYLLGSLCENPIETFDEIKKRYDFKIGNKVWLEHYILLRMDAINKMVLAAVENHDWKKVVLEIYNFCLNDLSMYFDARKDVLYCGGFTNTPNRVFALDTYVLIFHHLVRWLAPVIPFATEEAWQSAFGKETSVHCQTFDIVEFDFGLTDVEKYFEFPEFLQNIKSIRVEVMKQLEDLRSKKQINSALERHVIVPSEYYFLGFNRWVFKDWENLFGVAGATIRQKPGQTFKLVNHFQQKCERCWKHNVFGTLSHDDTSKKLCDRCKTYVEES
jgi:isoleucyl-tRNA synthetase